MTILLLIFIIIQNITLRYEIDDLKEQILSLQDNSYNKIKSEVLEKLNKSIKSL